MKYMTFNRSCSYAGIANLLEEYDLHYEDHEIIKALSIPYIDKYQDKIVDFCSKQQDIKTLVEIRDTLFAPLLIDILAMMELIEETALAIDIKNICVNFMKAMKETQAVLLADYIAPEYLSDIILRYKKIVLDYIEKYKTIRKAIN